MTTRAAITAARLAGVALAASALLAGAQAWGQGAGKRAWTQAGVSSGLHSLNHAATVIYQPAKAVPRGAVITQVHADRDYVGQASIQTSLCWKGTGQCVDIVGRSINTKAFNGLDATQPMYLVHRARAWRGGRPPIHVKGNVTVWYQTQP